MMSDDLCSLALFRTVLACTGSAATGTTRWLAAASARRDMSRYQWTASPVTRKVYTGCPKKNAPMFEMLITPSRMALGIISG